MILKPHLALRSVVLVIELLLVLDRLDYEHDYEQEHAGSSLPVWLAANGRRSAPGRPDGYAA